MEVKRSHRVGLLIQKEISALLLKGIKDPLVKMVSISKVKLSDDLRVAKIFVSAIGSEEERKNTVYGLNRAGGFVRSQLRKRLKMKTIPTLTFVLDTSYEEGERIDRLLEEVESKSKV